MTCRNLSKKCTSDVCFCPQYNLDRFTKKDKALEKMMKFGSRYGIGTKEDELVTLNRVFNENK